MAHHHEYAQRFKGLKLDTGANRSASASLRHASRDGVSADANPPTQAAISGTTKMADQQCTRATLPMTIPTNSEIAVSTGSSGSSGEGASYMDRYMRNRNPAISFSNQVITDSGHYQDIDQPLRTMDRQKSREHRSNSESIRDHYDPITGRQLPQFSTSPPRDEPHVGEARFPLLQQTVDELARESRPSSSQAISLTTASTVSTRGDESSMSRDELSPYPLSPILMSPNTQSMSASVESPRSFRRTASERWRNGERTTDVFSQARSLRSGAGSWRAARRDTLSSARSPNSAASSFLRAFSMGSGGDDSNGPSAVDAEGQTIGDDYVLGKQIGFGGYSIVREVTQLSSGKQRKLAVKIVRRNIEGKSEADNETAQTEFEHEVELWRFLSHPHILPLEAVYKLEEATFCFIPLNTGGTLFDIVRNNRSGIPLEFVRHYFYQLASALRYLHHDVRIVHRDIKLENVLIDEVSNEPGNVRVCDFGMAEWISNDDDSNSDDSRPPSQDRPPQKLMGPADSSTAAFAGGSLEYAAPEVVRRATSHRSIGSEHDVNAGRSIVSPAVDIWAFGVCLYTLLMGQRPFHDGFAPKVVMAILAAEWNEDAVREKLAGQSYAEDVMELLQGCLQKDQRRRYRIDQVIDCDWFEKERQKDDSSKSQVDGGRTWRL